MIKCSNHKKSRGTGLNKTPSNSLQNPINHTLILTLWNCCITPVSYKNTPAITFLTIKFLSSTLYSQLHFSPIPLTLAYKIHYTLILYDMLILHILSLFNIDFTPQTNPHINTWNGLIHSKLPLINLIITQQIQIPTYFQSTHTNNIINTPSNYATNSPKKHHFNPKHTYTQIQVKPLHLFFSMYLPNIGILIDYFLQSKHTHSSNVHTNQYNCLQKETTTLYSPTKSHLT